MSGVVVYGTRRIPGVTRVVTSLRDQQSPTVTNNPETSRVDRLGVRATKLITLDGGLGVLRGTEASKDFQRIRYSDGVQTHIFGGTYLPPAMTTQVTLAAIDVSGYRAAGLRAHAINTTLGQSKNRFYTFLGKRMYRTTSDSNPALADSGLSLANNVLGVFEGRANNTRYVMVTTDDVTEDAFGIADPSGAPTTKATIFAYSAGDKVYGGFALPRLGSGFNIWYGKIGGVTGLHFTKFSDALLTAPKAVVLTATANLPNSSNTILTTGPQNPSVASVEVASATSLPWSAVGGGNLNSALVSADSEHVDITTVDPQDVSDYLLVGGFDFSAVPLDNEVIGIKAEVRVDANASGDDVRWRLVQLLVRGGATGVNKASLTEWGTAAAYQTFGGTTDNWGTELTGADLRFLTIRLQAEAASTASSFGTQQVDHVRVTVYTRPKGTQASIPLGGEVVGIDPSANNVVYIRAPEFQDDAGAINVPRILWKLTFAYDSTNDRPTVTMEKVPTLLSHVESVCFAMQGILVTGELSAGGLAKQVRRIDSSGQVFDMGFGGGQGFTENWGIVNLFGADRAIIAQCALEDASVAQDYICVDGKWSALGPRKTITALPIAYAAATVDLNQRYRYRFSPSGTHLDADREFTPVNLLQDPLQNNTSVVKQDGVLVAQTPELDLLGPEESLKALLNAWCLSRDVSSTNTIRLRYSTDGGSNWTTWVTFTAFGSKSTLAPPVAERTVILEIGLNHTSSSSATPKGLPILIEGVALWPLLRTWRVYLNPEDSQFMEEFAGIGGFEGLFSALRTLQNTLVCQDFKPGNGITYPATIGDLRSVHEGTPDPALNGPYVFENDQSVYTGHFIEFNEVSQ